MDLAYGVGSARLLRRPGARAWLSATLPNYQDVAQFMRVNPKKGPSCPATLSICAALALLTPLVNPGPLYRGGKGT